MVASRFFSLFVFHSGIWDSYVCIWVQRILFSSTLDDFLCIESEKVGCLPDLKLCLSSCKCNNHNDNHNFEWIICYWLLNLLLFCGFDFVIKLNTDSAAKIINFERDSVMVVVLVGEIWWSFKCTFIVVILMMILKFIKLEL